MIGKYIQEMLQNILTTKSQYRTTSRKLLLIEHTVTCIIIYMKKSLDSDWPRAVHFKCNTSAKSVTPVEITHRNSGL